jgi:hypothetical protein
MSRRRVIRIAISWLLLAVAATAVILIATGALVLGPSITVVNDRTYHVHLSCASSYVIAPGGSLALSIASETQGIVCYTKPSPYIPNDVCLDADNFQPFQRVTYSKLLTYGCG